MSCCRIPSLPQTLAYPRLTFLSPRLIHVVCYIYNCDDLLLCHQSAVRCVDFQLPANSTSRDKGVVKLEKAVISLSIAMPEFSHLLGKLIFSGKLELIFLASSSR